MGQFRSSSAELVMQVCLWTAGVWQVFPRSQTRARSNGNFARPNIDRLIAFNRFTCPSTAPLLHAVVTAAATAASSERIDSANERMKPDDDCSACVSQSARDDVAVPRTKVKKPSTELHAPAHPAIP